MKAEGLRGIRREKRRRTTIGEGAKTPHPVDLVERKSFSCGPSICLSQARGGHRLLCGHHK
jgi:putative transposase